MSIVYSTQRGDFLPGFVYRNPRYFQRPMAEGARVYVVGSWPQVVDAYSQAGTEVITAETPDGLVRMVKADDEGAVEHEPAAGDDARNALRAEYEALTGDKPDRRWGEKRLLRGIEEARSNG